MSIVTIPILDKKYQMGCENGQESRLIELGKMIDARAREINDKIGNLPETSLLATLCIVLMDEVKSANAAPTPDFDESALIQILEQVRKIRKDI